MSTRGDVYDVLVTFLFSPGALFDHADNSISILSAR